MEQKLCPAYYETPEGKAFIGEIVKLCETEKKIVVDTFDGEEDIHEYRMIHGIPQADVRFLISESHGHIVKEIVDRRMDVTILMTGGDTLMGYMKLIGCTQLEPVCEIEPGVVVSMLVWNGYRQQVISKSGGFGTEDIMGRIAQKIVK